MQEHVRQALLAGGWIPGRRVDISADLAAHQIEDYPVWRELEAFLTEYSGLRFREGDGSRDIWISGVAAVAGADPGWIEAYEEVLDTRLSPVGGYQAAFLMLGQDAHLYGGFDRAFGDLGETLPEAMQRLWHPGGETFEYQITD